MTNNDRKDPFLSFRFQISLDALPVGGFSECSGIQLETEIHDYPEGGLNSHVHKFPTRTKQTNIILKRGIVDWELWEWYYQLTQGEMKFRTCTITLLDASGAETVAKWEFKQAFPHKWSGPELNAAQNNVAVETLELCHHGFTRQT